MTNEEARQVAHKALADTSAKHLEVEFAFLKEGEWIVLLSRGDQEWVVKIPEGEVDSPEQFRSRVAEEVRRLF